jgi:amino acid permease
MYLVIIPLTYKELENRSNKAMSGVLLKVSVVAIVAYVMVGIFSYLTFVHTPNLLTQNILEAPYGKNIAI